MINNLFSAIFTVFYASARFVVGILTTPLYNILRHFIPDLSDYISAFNTFLNDYVFSYLAFARDAFCNITCIPIGLFNTIVYFAFGLILLGFATIPIQFILNMYSNLKRGILKQ